MHTRSVLIMRMIIINVIIIDARVEPVSNTQEYNKQQCFFSKIMLAKHLKTLDAVTAYKNQGCYDKKSIHSAPVCHYCF